MLQTLDIILCWVKFDYSPTDANMSVQGLKFTILVSYDMFSANDSIEMYFATTFKRNSASKKIEGIHK